MKYPIYRSFYRCAALLLAASLPLGTAHAQLQDLMGKGTGKGDLKGLAGQLGGHSLTSGSLGNVAGLLQYCVTNNYLGGGQDVNSVQDKLMEKLPGGSKSTDPGFVDGLKGQLHSSDGKKLDLTGSGGIKEQVTKQACDAVLAQAKSFL